MALSSGLNLGPGLDLRKQLGKFGLHSFADNFNRAQITKWDQLVNMTGAELRAKCTEIGLPPPAIEHLLKNMNKTDSTAPKASSTSGSTSTRKRKAAAKPTSATTSRPSQSSAAAPKPAVSAREASSYYHFESTPAELAAQYDAQRVENAQEAEWQTGEGFSAWNPGNTHESRDYSFFAKPEFERQLKEASFGDFTVSKITSSDITYEVVSTTRGKIKWIYLMGFKAKLSTGELEVTDIMPDDDDWYINVTKCSRDEKRAITAAVPDVIEPIVESITASIKARLGFR